tara:strand:- start:16 stop:264 length:249 start_codon:yes stop_codon:yes gene_type:complete
MQIILLTILYANGQGVPQDYKAAVRWYTKAAEQGDENAQVNLGLMYDDGTGVPQDKVHAYMRISCERQSASGSAPPPVLQEH